MTEIEYSNPTSLSAGEWQVSLAEEAVSNASSKSAVSSTVDIERETQGSTLLVRIPDGSNDTTVTAVRKAIEAHLPNAVHVETRTD